MSDDISDKLLDANETGITVLKEEQEAIKRGLTIMNRTSVALAVVALSSSSLVAQSFTAVTGNLQHGQGTDSITNHARQITALQNLGADLIAVQERTTAETGWNAPMSSAGLVEAIYHENAPSQGDGPAIWYKASTVTVLQTYSRDLSTGANPSCGIANLGWDCSTDVRKAAVAVKLQTNGQTFYFISTHLCWSACADSNGSTFSVQRENQVNDLLSWINSTLTGFPVLIGLDANFGPDYPKHGGGLVKDLFTANYDDLWNVGLSRGVATTPWGDRDQDGIADMTPADLGTQTAGTRTHDLRRIDYLFLTKNSTTIRLNNISVPDSRAVCSVALTANGLYKECPDVNQLWDVADDQGVRASDHNFIKVILDLTTPPACLKFNRQGKCVKWAS